MTKSQAISAIKLELGQLGPTPRAIASKLKRLGFCGKRKRGDACCLHNYLKSKGFDVFVEPENLYLGGYDHSETDFIKLPKKIQDFLVEFDGGNFPHLIEKTKRNA